MQGRSWPHHEHGARCTVGPRALVVCMVIAGTLGTLDACSSGTAIPQGQTRFVATDRFKEIRDCELLTAHGSECYARSTGATPQACGSEPAAASVSYGTGFFGLIVPSRAIAPREKLKETLTKDGQVVAFNSLDGAEVYSRAYPCFVDDGLFSTTETTAADDEFQRWPGGPLPAGRYHFELTSGTEVLSAGDLTVAASSSSR